MVRRKRKKPLGHCRICGRPLYDPISASRGIGPECARKIGYQNRRKFTVIKRVTPTSVFSTNDAYNEIINSITSGLLEGAIVYGLSYAFPPLGVFLIPNYDILKLSYTMLKASQYIIRVQERNRRRTIYQRTPEVSGELASFIATKGSDVAASLIVDQSLKSLGLPNSVGAEILKGTLSNGLAEGVGGLTSYTVGTIVGV